MIKDGIRIPEVTIFFVADSIYLNKYIRKISFAYSENDDSSG